jgi:hypothetical protein
MNDREALPNVMIIAKTSPDSANTTHEAILNRFSSLGEHGAATLVTVELWESCVMVTV